MEARSMSDTRGVVHRAGGGEGLGWWAAGLALIPVLIVGAVFSFGLVGTVVGLAADPFVDLPSGTDDNPLLVNVLGFALVVLLVVGLPYLALGVLLLAALRRLSARGWPARRQRRVAVIAGVVATAPFVPFTLAGLAYGLLVPLPGASVEDRRRTLLRTALAVVALGVLLAPLSLVAPRG
jgi:hypothetical protein